jgi:hypothetical protein
VDYTTTGLLANMKRRGFTPAGSGLTTDDFLQVLSEQLRSYIPAFLKGLREEFIIAQLSVTVTSPTVPIPPRACGAALRSIGWQYADGRVRPLDRIEPERRGDWALTGSEPQGFIFQGNNCILLPAVSSGTLVVSYQQRPGELVLPTDCAVVTTINSTVIVTVASMPASWGSGTLLDLVGAEPNFKLKAMDVPVNFVSGGTTISFSDTLPTDLAEGDFICAATETCVPQLPMECFDLLAQAAAFQIATSTGSDRMKSIGLSLERLEKQLASVLSPRADGSPRVIVNRSGIGRRRF